MNNGKKKVATFGTVAILALALITGGNIYSGNYEADKVDKTTYAVESTLTFKNDELKNQHYAKHGIEMGFDSADDYEMAAAAVVANPNALHKIEAEDGDDVYYLEKTNEFVIVSTRGYIRTYYCPRDGIEYFNRQ